ncbi:MAG: hypothetical protein RJA70_261 [Pseudomonadota bacterium]|jgi:hypothetical protein
MVHRYVKTAEQFGDSAGEVFPTLTAPLNRSRNRSGEPQVSETIVEAPGIEPSQQLRSNMRDYEVLATNLAKLFLFSIPARSAAFRLVPRFGAGSGRHRGGACGLG